jgi:hypothetical protein
MAVVSFGAKNPEMTPSFQADEFGRNSMTLRLCPRKPRRSGYFSTVRAVWGVVVGLLLVLVPLEGER